MATGLVHLHNILRWLILLFLTVSILQSFSGWRKKKTFTRSDRRMWLYTLIVAHVTLLIGIYQWLAGRYGILTTKLPPGVDIMKDKFYRFFWVEHPVGMVLAIGLITLGYGMSKKSVSDTTKFRRAFWYFTIALVIILITIPWPYRELVGRPIFPGF